MEAAKLPEVTGATRVCAMFSVMFQWPHPPLHFKKKKSGARKQKDCDDLIWKVFTTFALHFALGLPHKLASFFNVTLSSPNVPQPRPTPPQSSLALTSHDSSCDSGQPPPYSQSAPVARLGAAAGSFRRGFSPAKVHPLAVSQGTCTQWTQHTVLGLSFSYRWQTIQCVSLPSSGGSKHRHARFLQIISTWKTHITDTLGFFSTNILMY